MSFVMQDILVMHMESADDPIDFGPIQCVNYSACPSTSSYQVDITIEPWG